MSGNGLEITSVFRILGGCRGLSSYSKYDKTESFWAVHIKYTYTINIQIIEFYLGREILHE